MKHRRGIGKQQGEAFDITGEWILEQYNLQDGTCFYVRSWRLDPSGDYRSGFKPSLDRIDNARGYTKDNVRLTSWFWNALRGVNSIEQTLFALQTAAV